MMNKKKAGAYMGGGMAKKKKPMAATGYKEGGDTKKKETFGQAFKRNRKKFMNSGSAADYTFKHNGKSYNILQKGETKAGVMKKFSAPKKSLRPKTRPSAGISANTKKKIEETVKKVANTDSKARPSRPSTEKTETQKRNDAAKRKAIRRSSAASKTLGKDPAPVANSAKVAAGQAKYRDRGTPVQLTLSRRNLRKFKKDPSSLTKIEKDRLFKTLKRQGVAIPKGLSGNNR